MGDCSALSDGQSGKRMDVQYETGHQLQIKVF